MDELRLIGCHANGDARCTCVIGQEAAAALEAQAEENRRLREALEEIAEYDTGATDGVAYTAKRALSSTEEKD